jgi:translocation and assembly module TamA
MVWERATGAERRGGRHALNEHRENGRSVCRRLVVGLVLSGLGAAPGVAAEPDPQADVPSPVVTHAIEYRVEFEGSLLRGRQGNLLRESSQLLSLRDRPPASLGALERRAEGDLKRLSAVLRSEGYYDGTADYRIDETVEPVLVTLIIERGAPYQLERYDIIYEGDVASAGLPRDPGDVGVETGRRARAGEIVDAEQRLIGLLGERGHPLARVRSRRNVIDREARTIRSRIVVEPGPLVGFGSLRVSGLVDVAEDYVRRIQPWQPGQTYDRRLVADFRQDLLATRLFSAVSVVRATAPESDGNLALDLEVVEREFRTLGGGLSWGTDTGFELSAFWEHRNFFHENESLRLETRLGEIEQSFNAFFKKPRFRRRDQSLLADARIKRVETDAYKESNITGAIGLERELGPLWDGKLGVTAELTDITENRADTSLLLLGLPGSLIRDSPDDDLDPTEGTRLETKLTPYLATGDDDFLFLVTELGGSAYLSLHESDRVILAGRARVGSILGESRADIPATKRFYAGGGGSIRGYQYQRVGPLDEENDPLGGRSLLEVGTELRLRVTERFGLVPFVDGGTVYVDPDFSSDQDDTIRWAAGLGLRYYTPIGPLRVDFAFPLNKRDGIDDDFQFYVSIGQAY